MHAVELLLLLLCCCYCRCVVVVVVVAAAAAAAAVVVLLFFVVVVVLLFFFGMYLVHFILFLIRFFLLPNAHAITSLLNNFEVCSEISVAITDGEIFKVLW